MDIRDKQRNILLLAGVCVLALALALWGGLAARHPYAPVVELLRERGYTLEPDQLYTVGSFTDQSISAVLSGVNLEEAVAASLEGGFSSRVDVNGDVTLLLCALGNQDVITLFLLDGKPELCFVQPLLGGGLKPLAGEERP